MLSLLDLINRNLILAVSVGALILGFTAWIITRLTEKSDLSKY